MSPPTWARTDLGARLNAARQRQGLSMARLAKLTDLSASNVRELLNGKRTPTQSVAERLIRVLDLDERMAAELLAATGRWTSSFSGGEVRLDSD